MRSRPRGSRLAAAILGVFLAPRQRDYILGDLAEEFHRHVLPQRGAFRAHMWFWQQVFRSIPSSASRKNGRRTRKKDPYIMTLIQDLKFAARSLIKTPGFTAIAVLTLALGIGANTTIFSVVQSVLLRPLPYDEPERIIQIWETHPDRGWNSMSFSHPNFWDLWDQNESLEEIAAMTGAAMNLTGFEYPERLAARRASAGFFRVLRVEPDIGRGFLPGEDQPGGENRVALLGNGFWMRRYGGDSSVVGQTITLDDTPYTVIGVLPTGNPFPGQTDVYVPMVRGSNTMRSDHRLFVMGRLNPGVTADAAFADLGAIADGIGLQDEDGVLGVRIAPASQWIAGPQLRVALWVLMGAVGFLLLIACVNLTNLLLARATGRQREYAVCAALGAARGRLTSRILTESVVLGLVGAALGVGLSVLGIRLVQAFNPGGIPRLAEVGINHWVLGFTLVAALATGVVTGLVPGLQMPYGNLLTMLRDGDRGVAGNRRQHRTRSALVAAEAALSLMLLVGAGLLIRSFGELQRVDTGFDSNNRMSFQVSLPGSYGNEQRTEFLSRFLGRINEIPQVHAAGAVNMQPITGGSTGMGIATEDQMADESAVTWVDWRLITPDYFRTMGLPLLRGRNFTERDRVAEPWQAVISQQLADLLWPGEDPLGRRAALWTNPDQIAEIIGVVGGMRERGPQADPTMVVYLPYYGAGWTPVTFMVHTAGDPGVVIPTLRTVLGEIDSNLPISNIAQMDDLVSNSVAGNRFNMLLLGIFAGVAMLLALAGIYGVLAYSVTRRTNEIGVRVALGASHGNVLRQIVLQGMRPVVVGIAVGVVGAVGLSRFMSTLLFGVAPTDPVTFAGVAVLLAIAGLGACYLPARRALRVDPVAALREE
jgi:putative ABC transport system permease protein